MSDRSSARRGTAAPRGIRASAVGPLALAALVAALGAVGVHLAGRGFLDLRVYRWGGDAVLGSGDLYGPTSADIIWLPFTYPPFAALAMTATLLVPLVVLVGLWTAASAWALGCTLRLLLGEWQAVPDAWHRYGVPAAVLASIALQPVWSNTIYAQVNLMLMWAVVADLLGRDRPWRGALIGVCAGIKLTPIIFVALLVFTGRWREVGNAVLGFLATVAMGFAVLPGASWSYWTDVLWAADRIGGIEFASNQSINGVLARLLGGEPATITWFLVAGVVAFGILLLASHHWRLGDRDLAVALMGVAMLLASPISWWHHWVWAIPMAVALCRVRLWWVAGAWLAVFALRFPLWPPKDKEREFAWSPVEQVLGNGYVWAALLLVGFLAARAWLTRSPRRHRRGPGASHSPGPHGVPEQPPPPGRPCSS